MCQMYQWKKELVKSLLRQGKTALIGLWTRMVNIDSDEADRLINQAAKEIGQEKR